MNLLDANHNSSKKQRGRWKTQKCLSFSYNNFQALIRNEIPAIVISEFATLAECQALFTEIRNYSFREIGFGFQGSKKRIGLSYYEFKDLGKQAYFEQAATDTGHRNEIVKAAFDPIVRFQKYVANHSLSISVAQEAGFGHYFAGSFRDTHSAVLHSDSAPRYMPKDWTISKVLVQLGVGVHINAAEEGGEVVIYDRLWTPEADEYMIKEQIGHYTYDLVKEVPSITIKPQAGDVILLNTNHFHEVLPVQKGQRISMGLFLGKTPDNRWVYWS